MFLTGWTVGGHGLHQVTQLAVLDNALEFGQELRIGVAAKGGVPRRLHLRVDFLAL